MTADEKINVKKRRPEQKYGKYKWLRILIRRQNKELRQIKRMLKGLSYGLRNQMDYDPAYLFGMVCRDSRDEAILNVLREAGPEGLLPRDIHSKVTRFGLKYHHITRRINMMNKLMKDEIGERVADKVGAKWALSDFMNHNWVTKKNEIEAKIERK